ncbi:MAG: hypothetical protein H6613_17780 [Ignavibacteriales bacterium]|nr:hypothetical protein [Ignavibacteriales bacterium]
MCPNGWHIPSRSEFETLKNEVGSDGNALKAIGEGNGNGLGTNTSGFSALLSSNREEDGTFYTFGYYAYFGVLQSMVMILPHISKLHCQMIISNYF